MNDQQTWVVRTALYIYANQNLLGIHHSCPTNFGKVSDILYPLHMAHPLLELSRLCVQPQWCGASSNLPHLWFVIYCDLEDSENL